MQVHYTCLRVCVVLSFELNYKLTILILTAMVQDPFGTPDIGTFIGIIIFIVVFFFLYFKFWTAKTKY